MKATLLIFSLCIQPLFATVSMFESDSDRARNDLVEKIESGAFCQEDEDQASIDIILSTYSNMNSLESCRTEILENSANKAAYCQCIKNRGKFTIDIPYLKRLKYHLTPQAEAQQIDDLLTGYLDLKSAIDKSIKQTTTFFYSDIGDPGLLCREFDIKNILANLESPKSKCHGKKFDTVLELLEKSLKSTYSKDENYELLIKQLPKSLDGINSKMKRDLMKIDSHAIALEKAIAEILPQLNSKQLPDVKQLEVYNTVFANDPLFKKIKIKYSDGTTINPEGEYDLTKYLVNLDESAERLKENSFIHIANAIRKEKVVLGEDHLLTTKECQSVQNKLEILCDKVVNTDNYLQKIIEDDPEELLSPITNNEGAQLQMSDLLIPGALQCIGAGMNKEMIEPDALEYMKSELPYLISFDKKKIGNYLREGEYYNNLVSPIIGLDGVAPKKEKDAKKTESLNNRVADTVRQDTIDNDYKKDLGRIVQRDSNGNIQFDSSKGIVSSKRNSILNGLSSFGRDQQSSRIVEWTGDSRAPKVEASQTTPASASPSSFQNTQINSLSNNAPYKFAGHNDDGQEYKKRQEAPSAMPSQTFEDRLAKIFEAQQASKVKEVHPNPSAEGRSVASKGNDYRYQQSLEQINQLKKSIEDLKAEKSAPTPSTVSTPMVSSENRVAPRVATFKGLDNSTSSPVAPSSNIAAHSAVPTRSAASASSSGGGSVSSSSSSSSASTPSAIDSTASKSSGFGGFKSSGGGSNFTLSREEVGQGEKVIIPASTFNAEDGEYLKKLYEQTKGEPIFLSQTDATGREQFVMLEAVVKADGSIEYIPVDKKDSKETKAEGKQRSKRKPSSQEATVEKNDKKRTKVDDLKSLLGEKL